VCRKGSACGSVGADIIASFSELDIVIEKLDGMGWAELKLDKNQTLISEESCKGKRE
jgi:hypothetical protein